MNGWLSDVEMEELKREVHNEGGASQDTSTPTHMSGEMTTANERGQERGHSTSWEIEQLTDEEKGNFNKILKVVNKGVREALPVLQKVDKKKS